MLDDCAIGIKTEKGIKGICCRENGDLMGLVPLYLITYYDTPGKVNNLINRGSMVTVGKSLSIPKTLTATELITGDYKGSFSVSFKEVFKRDEKGLLENIYAPKYHTDAIMYSNFGVFYFNLCKRLETQNIYVYIPQKQKWAFCIGSLEEKTVSFYDLQRYLTDKDYYISKYDDLIDKLVFSDKVTYLKEYDKIQRRLQGI